MTGNKRKGMVLQERDVHFLRELRIMRVVDREQASRVAPFQSVTRANCRLLALTRAGLLLRFFLGTRAGGKKALYMLSPAGAKLVGTSSIGPKRKRDQVVAVDLFVAHQLLINELYCGLKYGNVSSRGVQFGKWLTFSVALEPDLPLVPDGYVEFEVAGGESVAAFIEVDLGHERLAVWRKKVNCYLQFAVSGHFEERFGKRQFLVLVLTESPGRMASLRAATASLTDKIFRFTTFPSIQNDQLWSPVWLKPESIELQPIVKTT